MALQLNRPNSPQEWADLYPASDEVVTSLNSVLARTIAELTTEGDVLLEAGCALEPFPLNLPLWGE